MSTLSQKILERNKKVLKTVAYGGMFQGKQYGKEALAYRESFKKAWGIDPYDPAMLKEGFNFAKAHAKMMSFRESRAGFREAEVTTGWTQLLRAGIQNVANDMYHAHPVSFDQWVTVVPSDKDTELYDPLHTVGFPNEIPQGGLYGEVSTAGLDIKLRNKKYGSMFAVSVELSDDDQTGQINKKATQISEYLKVLTEVLVMGKLLSPSGGSTYSGFKIPVSETKPSTEANYPWTAASAPFVGGGFNRPASYTLVNYAGITAGIQQLMGQKDLLGNIISVGPTHLIHSPQRLVDVAAILHSTYYPAGAQSAGVTGGAFSENQLKGIVAPICTPYMPKSNGTFAATAETWFLVDAKKPAFIVQQREGISLVAEAPNSGQGFERDIQRYKCKMRQNADFIDPRFMWLGNDGSVTS
jgi:hypothetical protein